MSEDVNVEKGYSTRQVAAKLRRLAEALENGTPFTIQIAGNRVVVPPDATIEFEYERTPGEEEIEIEISWRPGGTAAVRDTEQPGAQEPPDTGRQMDGGALSGEGGGNP